MDVRLPDGTIITNVPENITRAELEVRLSRLQPSATSSQRRQAGLPGRILQGARDPIDAAAQLLPRGLEFVTSAGGFAPNRVSEFFGSEARRVDDINARNEQAYQAARSATGQSGFDGGRLIGNVVSPVNAAAAAAVPIRGGMSVGQLAARGAGAGAIGGALQPVNDPAAQENFAGEKTAQVLMGAGTGAVLSPVIARGVEAGVRRLSRPNAEVAGARASLQVDQDVANALRDIGQTEATVGEDVLRSLRDQAVQALKTGRRLDVAAALRNRDFQAVGVQPLQGQLTRDPMQFARERNLRGIEGVGEQITARLTDQRRTMGDMLRGYSAGMTDRADAGQSIIDALQATDDQMGARIRGLYQTARESAKADLSIPLQGFAQDVADVSSRFGDKVPSGVMNQIRDLGLLTGTQRKVFTLADADRLSKVINDNVGNDPATNAALTALRQSLRRAVESAVPSADNPFAPAVQAAAERFQLRDALPALKAATTGTANEDAFVRQFVLQARPAEVRKLADVLGSSNPDALAQARSQVGAYLERAAFGQNLAGDKAFAPERFAAALNALGRRRLEAFYTPEQISQLNSLARVGAYINSEPAAAAVNRSNTASAGTNVLAQVLRRIPFGGDVMAVGNAVASPVVNNRRLTQALSAQVPQALSELTPEQIRALSRIAGPLIVGSGVVGASPVAQ